MSRPTSSKAVAALVISLIALVTGALPVGIVGLILGYSARDEIHASNGTLDGDGLATAGIVIGWICLALTLVGCVIFGIMLTMFGGLFFFA